MPSAVPVPRGPSHLVLFGAEDLLRGTGCPVCRYESEADDRFSGWFAVGTHADSSMITRLSRSLGTCPVHSRGLLRQPGAGIRMTAVYRYLLRAAVEYLTAGTSPQARCPACAHGAEATLRAVDTLVTAGQDGDLREGAGLCLPHLRTALSRSGRRLGSRLAAGQAGRLAGARPDLAALAGDRDADADLRARLRAALPAAPAAAGPERGGVCPVCLTAAQAERDPVAQAGGTGWCPAHLHDAYASEAAGCSGPRSPAAALLAREAGHARPPGWPAGPRRRDRARCCAGSPAAPARPAGQDARSVPPPARRVPRPPRPSPIRNCRACACGM